MLELFVSKSEHAYPNGSGFRRFGESPTGFPNNTLRVRQPLTIGPWMRSRCPIPALAKSSVKAKWLSVDPYMRGRMSPATNYTKGVEIGEVMQGGGVGEVVASNHPKWKAGDIAKSMSFSWQEWSVLTP